MDVYRDSTALCADYIEDFVWVLRETEQNRLTLRYTSPQLRYRELMVSFVRKISEKQRLRRSTVHLAIYLMDAFMDNHNVTDNRLNLVALCSVLLAAKIEENEPNVPSLSLLNKLVLNQYPLTDFAVLEVLLLTFFKWHLIIPTAANFVEHWLINIVKPSDLIPSTTERQFNEKRSRAIELALEFLDITLGDIKMTNVTPSLLASACIAAARSTLPVLLVWTDEMAELTGYSYGRVTFLARELMNWRTNLIAKETACRKRYAIDSGYITDVTDTEEEHSDVSLEWDSDEVIDESAGSEAKRAKLDVTNS